MKLTIFDIINNICYDKQDIINEDNQRQYVPFLVNRGLSQYVDCVLLANDMNLYHELPVQLQNLYFLSSVSKRKRFSKWAKRIQNDDLALIQEMYQCNERRAEELFSVMSSGQLEYLRQMNKTGKHNGKRNK